MENTHTFYELTLWPAEGECENERLLLRVDKGTSPWQKCREIDDSDTEAMQLYVTRTLWPAVKTMLINWTFENVPCTERYKDDFIVPWSAKIARLVDIVQKGRLPSEGELCLGRATAMRPLTPEEVVYWPNPVPRLI